MASLYAALMAVFLVSLLTLGRRFLRSISGASPGWKSNDRRSVGIPPLERTMHVMFTVIRILSAWPMVARRSLANWKLLSSVVVGVVLASTIMAGTVIYFDSLRNLALEAELERRDPLDLDILTKTTKGPTTPLEYTAVRDVIEGEYGRRIGCCSTMWTGEASPRRSF